jgi:hypothetical protein
MQGEEGEDNPKSPGTAALLEVPLRLAGLAMLLDCSGFTPLLTPNCSAAAAFFCSPTPPLYVQENLSDDEEEYAVGGLGGGRWDGVGVGVVCVCVRGGTEAGGLREGSFLLSFRMAATFINPCQLTWLIHNRRRRRSLKTKM